MDPTRRCGVCLVCFVLLIGLWKKKKKKLNDNRANKYHTTPKSSPLAKKYIVWPILHAWLPVTRVILLSSSLYAHMSACVLFGFLCVISPAFRFFMLFLFCFFVCFCLVFYFSSFQRKRKQKNCQRDVNEKRDVHTGTHVRSTRVYTNRNKHVETGRVFPIVVVVPLVLWRLCIERRSKLGNKRMGGFSLFLSFSTSPKDWQRWRVRDDLTATTLLTPQQATTSTLWDNTYTAVSYTNLLFLFYFIFLSSTT